MNAQHKVERECDRYRPIYYASASGDFNPVHLDPEVARAAGLSGTILHGMCTMSWAAEAAIDALGGDPGSLKKLSVRFSRPVQLGDRITLTATVDGKQVKLEAVNQSGQDVLKRMIAEGA